MADIKAKYGTFGQAITITLNSLASSATAGRESDIIDNSSNLYLDALVQVAISFPNLTPANDKAVYVYAYASVDGGTTCSGGVSPTDGVYNFDDPTPLKLIGIIPTPTANKNYVSSALSVAQAFGGVLPQKWGIIVRNYTGQSLNGSGNAAQYQGVLGQSV